MVCNPGVFCLAFGGMTFDAKGFQVGRVITPSNSMRFDMINLKRCRQEFCAMCTPPFLSSTHSFFHTFPQMPPLHTVFCTNPYHFLTLPAIRLFLDAYGGAEGVGE
jgi:hypothetical protein